MVITDLWKEVEEKGENISRLQFGADERKR